MSLDDITSIKLALSFTVSGNQLQLRRETARLILPTCRWIFPQKRRDIYGIRGGGYFVSAQERPGEIKIGFTGGSIASRIRALRYQGAEQPKLIAIALTWQYKQLEGALHAIFSESHVDSEWFEANPVLAFLEQFRDGVS